MYALVSGLPRFSIAFLLLCLEVKTKLHEKFNTERSVLNDLLSNEFCTDKELKDLFYDGDSVKNIIWTGVHIWKNLMSGKCFTMKLTTPTAKIIRHFKHDMANHVLQQIEWEKAVIYLFFKTKQEDHEALLFNADPEQKIDKGNYRVVPYVINLQKDMRRSPTDMFPLLNATIREVDVSYDDCPHSRFLLFNICGSGGIMMTEMVDGCPTRDMINEVAESLKLPDGYPTCRKGSF